MQTKSVASFRRAVGHSLDGVARSYYNTCMRFYEAIDLYVADMRAQGRLNSPSSERGYRSTLLAHAEDVHNRDPAYVGREDVKRTLRRWPNANTQGTNRSKLVSFYGWTMEEGLRKDNPAEQTRRPRRRAAEKYRLTEAEVIEILAAAQGTRERRAIFLGLCAGLRNAELRGLQGRHFGREGLVWVSADIAKGRRERWVPVIADLAPIVEEIRTDVGSEEYALPTQRFRTLRSTRLVRTCGCGRRQVKRYANLSCASSSEPGSRRMCVPTTSATHTRSTSHGRPIRASHSTCLGTLTSGRPTPTWAVRA